MSEPTPVNILQLIKQNGARLTRRSYQRGGLKKIGPKSCQQWQARWKVYVMVDGAEKRRDRTKVIGPTSTVTRAEANRILRALIDGSQHRFQTPNSATQNTQNLH